jgi:hypothetical protein
MAGVILDGMYLTNLDLNTRTSSARLSAPANVMVALRGVKLTFQATGTKKKGLLGLGGREPLAIKVTASQCLCFKA